MVKSRSSQLLEHEQDRFWHSIAGKPFCQFSLVDRDTSHKDKSLCSILPKFFQVCSFLFPFLSFLLSFFSFFAFFLPLPLVEARLQRLRVSLPATELLRCHAELVRTDVTDVRTELREEDTFRYRRDT